MIRQLPDVNVLLALLWPRHEAHAAAQRWFETQGSRAWATSPLTELGVLRLLTNPLITQGAVTSSAALSVVTEFTTHKGHEFWPLERKTMLGISAFVGRIRGYRQWTDAALLAQAAARDGVLVTFDSGLKELAPRDSQDRVLLLKQKSQPR